MSDDKNICGGITDDDAICRLPSGWGRESSNGPCRHHEDEKHPPRKLTRPLIANLESDLQDGVSINSACKANGIHKSTYYDWLDAAADLDDDDESERAERLSDFSDRVTRARGEGERDIQRDIVAFARQNEDPMALIRYLKEIFGGEDGGDRSDDAPLANVPTDEQLAGLFDDAEDIAVDLAENQ